MIKRPYTQHLQDLTESAWNQLLESPLSLSPDVSPVRAECAAAVCITGAWNGMLVVACCESLARQAAARLFHRPEGSLSDLQWQDALKEIATVIGGNMKAVLPGPSALDLPVFLQDWLPPTDALRVSYGSSGARLQVLLLESTVG